MKERFLTFSNTLDPFCGPLVKAYVVYGRGKERDMGKAQNVTKWEGFTEPPGHQPLRTGFKAGMAPSHGMESLYCQNIVSARAHCEETVAHPLEIFVYRKLLSLQLKNRMY